MLVSKLGEYVSVLDVMKNGSKHLHGSDWGIVYTNGPSFYAQDTSLVCVGAPTPFPTPMEQPDVDQGFAHQQYLGNKLHHVVPLLERRYLFEVQFSDQVNHH